MPKKYVPTCTNDISIVLSLLNIVRNNLFLCTQSLKLQSNIRQFLTIFVSCLTKHVCNKIQCICNYIIKAIKFLSMSDQNCTFGLALTFCLGILKPNFGHCAYLYTQCDSMYRCNSHALNVLVSAMIT